MFFEHPTVATVFPLLFSIAVMYPLNPSFLTSPFLQIRFELPCSLQCLKTILGLPEMCAFTTQRSCQKNHNLARNVINRFSFITSILCLIPPPFHLSDSTPIEVLMSKPS